MKILHTADWHLGQTFYEYDRKAEHLVFLSWLKKVIKEQAIDLLLIAGDVFDGPNPSADSQRIYYRFLQEITAENPDLQLIIIAGNHDSAARLEAPNPLLGAMNITVKGLVQRDATGALALDSLLVPLNKGGYCLAVPYLRQGDYPPSSTYAEGVKAMYEALYEQVRGKEGPFIALGHLQATGSEISENDRSERTVIGGLESVSPDAFSPEIAYTALGHLHRAQRVSGRENVRYSGAPLPMSFAEKNNKQGVTLVELSDTTHIERLPFTPPVALLSIPKVALPLTDVLAAIAELPEGELTAHSPYLEIKVLVTEPEPSLRFQVEEALQHKSVRLARIAAERPAHEVVEKTMSYEELQQIHPMEMAVDIFKRNYGGEDMPLALKELFQKVVQEVKR